MRRADPVVRAGARVEGVVQGVGFRPYVHRLAGELGLTGWVLNDERGVLLEVEGPEGAVDSFLERLPREVPPLASVERVERSALDPVGEAGFEIRASPWSAPSSPRASPVGGG